jgi:hypothetical protein
MIVPLMKERAAKNKAMGIPVASHKKRARKAYTTRLVNIGLKDYERFTILLRNLEKREGNKRRSSFIIRKYNQRYNQIHG